MLLPEQQSDVTDPLQSKGLVGGRAILLRCFSFGFFVCSQKIWMIFIQFILVVLPNGYLTLGHLTQCGSEHTCPRLMRVTSKSLFFPSVLL